MSSSELQPFPLPKAILPKSCLLVEDTVLSPLSTKSLLGLPAPESLMQRRLGSQTRGTEREETTWMVGFIFKIYQVWPFFLTSIIFACDIISLLNGLSGLTLLPQSPFFI